MDTLPEPTTTTSQRHAWIGYALGLGCMAALFIAGLATGTPHLPVMASSIAGLLAFVWTWTSAAATKTAGRQAPARRGA